MAPLVIFSHFKHATVVRKVMIEDVFGRELILNSLSCLPPKESFVVLYYGNWHH